MYKSKIPSIRRLVDRLFFPQEMSGGKLFGKDLSEYDDVDVDTLLEQLSPEELELLAGDVDPDVSAFPL